MVRHRVLVPGSGVRIPPPQPNKMTVPARTAILFSYDGWVEAYSLEAQQPKLLCKSACAKFKRKMSRIFATSLLAIKETSKILVGGVR